jgi:hypothetical protein
MKLNEPLSSVLVWFPTFSAVGTCLASPFDALWHLIQLSDSFVSCRLSLLLVFYFDVSTSKMPPPHSLLPPRLLAFTFYDFLSTNIDTRFRLVNLRSIIPCCFQALPRKKKPTKPNRPTPLNSPDLFCITSLSFALLLTNICWFWSDWSRNYLTDQTITAGSSVQLRSVLWNSQNARLSSAMYA